MTAKMLSLLNAIVFIQKFYGKRTTIGEVSRKMEKGHSTVHRHMMMAYKLGLVQKVEFKRGKMLCHEFEITPKGNEFLDNVLF